MRECGNSEQVMGVSFVVGFLGAFAKAQHAVSTDSEPDVTQVIQGASATDKHLTWQKYFEAPSFLLLEIR